MQLAQKHGAIAKTCPNRVAAFRRVRACIKPQIRTNAAASLAPSAAGVARPLLIDNYDSYSYNLYQILAEVYGAPPFLYHNDQIDLEGLKRLAAEGQFHHIIISPGPGHPARSEDIGVCLDVLSELPDIPILGVCLGHQALAHVHGGAVVSPVVRAPEPVHGRLSTLEHSGHPLFKNIPSGPGNGFDVVRYHSLIVDAASVPPELEPIAWTCGGHHAVQLQGSPSTSSTGRNDSSNTSSSGSYSERKGLIMGLAHKQRPHYGVQFHPESIATRYGIQVLINFRDLAYQHCGWKVPAGLQGLNGQGPPGKALPPRSDWLLSGLSSITAAAEAAEAAEEQEASGAAARQRQRQQQQQHRGYFGSLWDGAEAASMWDASEGVVGSYWEPEDPAAAAGEPPGGDVARLRLCWQVLPGALDDIGSSQSLFEELIGAGPDKFWLDSASKDRARFSYMGSSGGPLWCRVMYQLPEPSLAGQRQQQSGSSNGTQAEPHPSTPGTLTVTRSDGTSTTSQASSIWAYLQQQLAELQLDGSALVAADELPFNFWGGFVGYLGYELKAEAEGKRSPHTAPTPDAGFFFADRVLVLDHHQGDVYVVALAGVPRDEVAEGSSRRGLQAAIKSAEDWVDHTAQAVLQLAGKQRQQQLRQQLQQVPVVAAAAATATVEAPAVDSTSSYAASAAVQPPPFRLQHNRQQYIDNVAACQAALVAGESYELCLTTSLRQPHTVCPWHFYKTLRAMNPAPYAAWLAFGEGSGQQQQRQQPAVADTGSSSCAGCSTGPVTVCCSSPERFLLGGRGGTLEAKPIKGTAPRHADPATDAALAAELQGSEKERAENLMIVDLLRNDLGRVCEVGSVHVPGLIEVESYATVHQLVSTVRGQRRDGVSCVEAVRAAFPGGSMTGAPKIRSMEILDDLEGAARGVYSGALGFFSVNDTFDLNIVIRTAVFAGGEVMIGAGGAVTVQSDAVAEYDEMRLKARALVRAMGVAQGLEQQQAEQNVVAE